MTDNNVPSNVWFAGVVISYREKGSSTIQMVVMSFGLRADDIHKARGKAEGICDRCVTEIGTDHPTATILAIRAVVSSGAGENGIIDSPDEFEIIREGA